MAEGEAALPLENAYLAKRLKSGKLERSAQPQQLPDQPSHCPRCGSQRLCKDGFYYRKDGGSFQRWLCRNCGFRFSEKEPMPILMPLQKTSEWHFNTPKALLRNRQVCDVLTEGSKNLP